MQFTDVFNKFDVVWVLFPKTIMTLGRDGFFKKDGFERGILVRRKHNGEVWYHRPENYLKWQDFLNT
jgi:hypothetical protein